MAPMNEELEKQLEHMIHVADMTFHLCELYGEGIRNRHYSTVSELLRTKMVKRAPIHQHELKMIGLVKQLESFDSPLDCNLDSHIFLASPFDSFSQFIMNYNVGKMEHTFLELLNMCVTAEKTFKKKGGNGTVAVFEKGSTSSTKPN
ncbi:uncharacterized protein LOC117621773 [Prunus dulcis]|uniref:uncharacterized protein LOC117621773 n=1 Tax=Prunus dulcis TaxID=3755 RepID=UPI001482EE08|nr:uncharacterized protein LOC117621773 [Prunus dulcis]